MLSRIGLKALQRKAAFAVYPQQLQKLAIGQSFGSTSKAMDDAQSLMKEDYSFVKSRKQYQHELSLLRKQFLVEHKKKQAKLARDLEAKKQDIMKAKAARLALKRQQQEVRAKQIVEEKSARMEAARQKFQEKSDIRATKANEMKSRRDAILAKLVADSQSWLEEGQLDHRLNERIFMYGGGPKGGRARRGSVFGGERSSAQSWLEKLEQMRPMDKDEKNH